MKYFILYDNIRIFVYNVRTIIVRRWIIPIYLYTVYVCFCTYNVLFVCLISVRVLYNQCIFM